jgi:hypothetical protein
MRLEPATVESYLRGTGWQVFEQDPLRASFWSRKDERSGEAVDVVCLLNPSFRDFAERMSELLESVSAFEHRSPDEVYRSIIDAAFDMADVQIERGDVADGTIPLKAGAHAFQGVMKMYAAAAAAEEEPKPFYLNLLSGKAAKFVSESARFGQTRVGSYVITIATKLPTPPQGRLHFGTPAIDDPFERRVMRRLTVALDAARHAAIADTEYAFEQGVQHGLSADLCDAVAKMAEGNAFEELNVSFRWSFLKPIDKVPSSVSFSPQLVRNLRAGGAHLRFQRPLLNYQLVGRVVRLERFPHEEEGTVGVLGFVGVNLAKVSVTLTKADYKLATIAHDSGESVVCVGELKREGKNYVLLGAHNFTIIRTTPSTPSSSTPVLD